jgi:hypothetical protein
MENSSLRQTNPNAEKSPLSRQPDDSGIEQVEINLRNTIPAATSIFLAKIEAIRSCRGLEGLAETSLDTLRFCNQDLIISHADKPELVEQLANIINEDPSKVTIHIALCNGYFYRAIFVDDHLRRGRAVSNALRFIPWSEFLEVILEGQFPPHLKIESI